MKQQITDAEWQIMRVLWECPGAIATDIAVRIFEQTNWSITTVKTFLSRLVEKSMVRYEIEGKSYRYFAAISERDCVVSEMKQVLHRVYGGVVHRETDHFQFYGTPNSDLTERLARTYETIFPRIESDYGYRQREKQMVYLYPSKSRLHSALGLSMGPEWLRAGWDWDIVHLAPEEQSTDIATEPMAVHVWLQRVIHEINPGVPYWLMQGIATYESRWLSATRLQTTLAKLAGRIEETSVERLSNQFDLFREQGGYELAYTVVDWIVRKFGKPALLRYLLFPADYISNFGMESTEFWTQWKTEFHARNAREKE
jgi:BlaI family transcriptional regulator, penicillinase repressor